MNTSPNQQVTNLRYVPPSGLTRAHFVPVGSQRLIQGEPERALHSNHLRQRE